MAVKRTPDAAADNLPDLLGKPLAAYTARGSGLLTLAAALILGVGGGAAIGAAGRLAYALAESLDGGPYRFVGWCMVVLGMAAAAAGVLQFGRRFEVRQKGVRFRRRRVVQEIRWDEMYDIIVRKEKYRVRGGAIVERWEIDLLGYDDAIYLKAAFLRQIPSVTELVSMLKAVSGKEIIMDFEIDPSLL
jgi:hypothetical protein